MLLLYFGGKGALMSHLISPDNQTSAGSLPSLSLRIFSVPPPSTSYLLI